MSLEQSMANTATHCNTLQHTTAHYNTLQCDATHLKIVNSTDQDIFGTEHVEHCNTLQHTAPHCTTLHHTAPHCTTLHHTTQHLKIVSSTDPDIFGTKHRRKIDNLFGVTRLEQRVHRLAHILKSQLYRYSYSILTSEETFQNFQKI